MLAGTAMAIADSLSQFPNELRATGEERFADDQIYAHQLSQPPVIDGYFDDWPLDVDTQRTLPGTGGAIQYVFGRNRQHLFLYVDVVDDSPSYANDARPAKNRDYVSIVVADNSEPQSQIEFSAEAPGPVQGKVITASTVVDSRITAHWQDTANGYRLEARLPISMVSKRLGIEVGNADGGRVTVRRSYENTLPGQLIFASPVLESVASGYARPGMRVTITNRAGWRLADAGDLSGGSGTTGNDETSGGWQQIIYRMLLKQGSSTLLADPDPSGREQQSYLARTLNGEPSSNWFRNASTGRAVVAVAYPVWSATTQTGALILQQDTAAIQSLTNASLVRLVTLTIVATVGAAAALLGYASWLSFRIRRLSNAAEDALDNPLPTSGLPSNRASDEIGDLSRSFSSVLEQLASYNDYLKTLASKLSHELRTPLTIVTSSLENLEHEALSEQSREYTKRASDGAKRLKNILSAMSEANRVEELMNNADTETFNLVGVLTATTVAYNDAWPERTFVFSTDGDEHRIDGSPELVIQMLDKLVGNAVDFSKPGDRIDIGLSRIQKQVVLTVSNPGPALPEAMRHRLFESMVSVRENPTGDNLGLGLNIAKLIAEGHGGSIHAENIESGVRFSVKIPRIDK